jgi:excisionase family DNA binding protein
VVLHASTTEITALRQLAHRLNSNLTGNVELIVDGQAENLPASAIEGLRRVISALAREAAVSIVPHGVELTTQSAADLLGISRPRLIQLLDKGAIKFRREGTHRRLRLDDVLAHRAERSKGYERAMRALQSVTDEYPGS